MMSEQEIVRVTCHTLNIPFKYPLMGKTSVYPFNYLEVETRGGIIGRAFSRYPAGTNVTQFINEHAAPVVIGQTVMETERIRARLVVEVSRTFLGGTWGCAASLIDLAVWDAKGQALGQPVWQLLGGARHRVPTYITFGSLLYSTEQLVELATGLVKDGHTRLKMVIGAGENPAGEIFGRPTKESLDGDIQRVRAVREAIGPDIELIVDANKNPSLDQAVYFAERVEDLGLLWFEDPVAMSDPRLLRQLRSKTNIPIAAGATAMADVMFLRELLINESVDVLQPNVRDIGGYTEGVKAIGLAEAFNVRVSMGGNWPQLNMHLHAGLDHGGLVEFHLLGWQLAESLFEGAVVPGGGWAPAPMGHGIGMTPKVDLVREFPSAD
jgi:L-rhamnonate dehydratase